MGVTIFRPGRRVVIPSPGVQVWSPRAASAASTWWDNNGAISGCVAAYQAKGAASLAESYTNLANPGTYTAAPGVAPTFNMVTGWTFNGSTQYLTTGITPAQGWSMIIRFNTLANVDSIIAGSQATGGAPTTQFMIIPRASGGATRVYRNGSDLSISGGKTSGVAAVAGASAYLDGAAETGSMANALSGAQPIFIGSRNNGGTASAFSNVVIVAFAIYNRTLSGAEISAETTLMNAL